MIITQLAFEQCLLHITTGLDIMLLQLYNDCLQVMERSRKSLVRKAVISRLLINNSDFEPLFEKQQVLIQLPLLTAVLS